MERLNVAPLLRADRPSNHDPETDHDRRPLLYRSIAVEFRPTEGAVGTVVVVDGMQRAAADMPTARNPTGDYPEIAPIDAPMRLRWSVNEAMAFVICRGADVASLASL